MEIRANLYLGDSKDVLKEIPSNSVDLIFTSPLYADQRKNTYGGIHPDEYVDWFLPISEEQLRVLHPKGTFVLNIKEKVIVPVGEWAKTRLKNLSETDKTRDESKVGSGYQHKINCFLKAA